MNASERRLTPAAARFQSSAGIRFGDLVMTVRTALRASILFCGAVALSGCNSSAPAPQASALSQQVVARANITPPDFQLPVGAGCTGDIARWQAVQDNDKRMGQVNERVAGEIASEISNASAACQAGHDGEARALVSASKRRHGYPG
jgi:hypothetical protein